MFIDRTGQKRTGRDRTGGEGTGRDKNWIRNVFKVEEDVGLLPLVCNPRPADQVKHILNISCILILR